LGNLNGRDHLKDIGIDGNRILKWMFRKRGTSVWTGFIWLRIATLQWQVLDDILMNLSGEDDCLLGCCNI
jgi:hypothetical protein